MKRIGLSETCFRRCSGRRLIVGRSGQGLAGVHDYICTRTRSRKAWLFIAHPPRPFSSVNTGDCYWVKCGMPTCQKEKGPANQKLRMRRPTNQAAD